MLTRGLMLHVHGKYISRVVAFSNSVQKQEITMRLTKPKTALLMQTVKLMSHILGRDLQVVTATFFCKPLDRAQS